MGTSQSCKCSYKKALISQEKKCFLHLPSCNCMHGVHPLIEFKTIAFFPYFTVAHKKRLDRKCEVVLFSLLFISWRKTDVKVSSILCIYSNFIGSYFSPRGRQFMVWISCNFCIFFKQKNETCLWNRSKLAGKTRGSQVIPGLSLKCDKKYNDESNQGCGCCIEAMLCFLYFFCLFHHVFRRQRLQFSCFAWNLDVWYLKHCSHPLPAKNT